MNAPPAPDFRSGRVSPDSAVPPARRTRHYRVYAAFAHRTQSNTADRRLHGDRRFRMRACRVRPRWCPGPAAGAPADGGRRGDAGPGPGHHQLRVRRRAAVAPLLGSASAGGRHHHADLREVGRPGRAGPRAAADRSAARAGRAAEQSGQPGRAGGGGPLRRAAVRAREAAARRGRHQPAGVRAGRDEPEHGPCRARRPQGAGARGRRAAAVLPRDRADRRHGGRHTGTGGRPRHDVDGADHGRPAGGPGSVHPSADRARAGHPAGTAGADQGLAGRPSGPDGDRLRLAAGGRPHAVGPGEGARAGRPGLSHRAVRARRDRLAQRAGPDGARDGRHAHQRAVLRVPGPAG